MTDVNPVWKPPPRPKRRTPLKDIGLETARFEVLERAHGECEVMTPSCSRWAGAGPHHRLKRGKIIVHDPAVMIAVCDRCHTGSEHAIHVNEGWSYRHGLLLRMGIEPFLVLGCPLSCEVDHTPGVVGMPATGVLFQRRRK